MIFENYGRTPEFPEYVHKFPKFEQPDWEEKNRSLMSYIKNKPNCVITINGMSADKHGDLNIFELINSIPNDVLYSACESIFDDVL